MLRPYSDEAKGADLTPSSYSVWPFPRPSRGGGWPSSTGTASQITSPHLPAFSSSFELSQVSLRLKHRVLYFFCVCRPLPSRKNKLTESMFFNQFPDLLDPCDSLSGILCILGGFNLQPQNPSSSKFLDFLSHAQPTSAWHRHGHTVDLVIKRPDPTMEFTDQLKCLMPWSPTTYVSP